MSADLQWDSGQCPSPAQGDPHLCGVLCSEPTALIRPCLDLSPHLHPPPAVGEPRWDGCPQRHHRGTEAALLRPVLLCSGTRPAPGTLELQDQVTGLPGHQVWPGPPDVDPAPHLTHPGPQCPTGLHSRHRGVCSPLRLAAARRLLWPAVSVQLSGHRMPAQVGAQSSFYTAPDGVV